MSAYPILYSFRRCPYAMRARLAIMASGLTVELREIVLKNKPGAMLTTSPKGTVPVLFVESEGKVVDESLDIMHWALSQNDPQGLLPREDNDDLAQQTLRKQCNQLIQRNDNDFKPCLDRYKYADRHPEFSQQEYRQQGEAFLLELEERLQKQTYLFGEKTTLADIAIMPFIRQFAHVDRNWFAKAPYPNLQRWLNLWLESPLFLSIMQKYQPWQEGDDMTLFGDFSLVQPIAR